MCACMCVCVHAGFAHIKLVTRTPGFSLMVNEGMIIHFVKGSIVGVPEWVHNAIQFTPRSAAIYCVQEGPVCINKSVCRQYFEHDGRKELAILKRFLLLITMSNTSA